MNWWHFPCLGRKRLCLIRAHSPLRPSRCAALPTSARSAFKWGESGHWLPTKKRIWQNLAFAPCWQETWLISCRLRLPACYCHKHLRRGDLLGVRFHFLENPVGSNQPCSQILQLDRK